MTDEDALLATIPVPPIAAIMPGMATDSANLAYLGLPPVDGAPRDPAAERQKKLWLEYAKRNAPGMATDDRVTQSRKLTGMVHIAIGAKAEGLSAATVKVMQRRTATSRKALRKAMATPGAQPNDEEWVPAEKHALCDLFEHVNENDTLSDLLMHWVTQRDLTGSALTAVVGTDGLGNPKELYPLMTAMCQPIPMGPYYPEGGWRVNNYSFGQGYTPGLMVQLQKREVLQHKYRHPLWLHDGWSPLSAGGRQLDILESIDVARKNAMDRGQNLSGFVNMPGASEDQVKDAQQRWERRFGGAENAGVVAFLGGDPDGDFRFTPASTGAKEMDFQSSWDQMVKFALALFGVPPAIAGLNETTSYSQLYASLQQFHTLCLLPLAAQISAFLTKHLALKVYGDRNLRIQLDLPKLNDPDLLEQQINSDAGNNAITVNEIRGLRGRKPWEGADLPPSAYGAKVQQAIAPPQPEPPPPGQMPANGTLNPSGASGDVPRPENPDGAGSLPGAMKKAFPKTEALLQEMGV